LSAEKYTTTLRLFTLLVGVFDGGFP